MRKEHWDEASTSKINPLVGIKDASLQHKVSFTIESHEPAKIWTSSHWMQWPPERPEKMPKHFDRQGSSTEDKTSSSIPTMAQSTRKHTGQVVSSQRETTWEVILCGRTARARARRPSRGPREAVRPKALGPEVFFGICSYVVGKPIPKQQIQ